jgi:hypothetical protein
MRNLKNKEYERNCAEIRLSALKRKTEESEVLRSRYEFIFENSQAFYNELLKAFKKQRSVFNPLAS